MVFLGLLGGLFVIGMPIAVIYLLVAHARLNRNVADLRRIILGLESAERNTSNSQPSAVKNTPQASADAGVLAPIGAKAPEPPKPAQAPPPAPSAQAMRIKSPEQTQKAPTAPPPVAIAQGPTALERLFAWLQQNWFYAVSAVSLALAGLFLVQYGMENGLLPPTARVLSALGFGAALIGVAEYIRRRFGEVKDSTTEYLPSVFAGAGIVSLFGGVLSAEMLYGLIGANTALLGMVVVAAIALVLGWFYGPLLAAVGVIGAFGAPFVLGGSNSDPTPLFAYYALVAAVGLGMDTLRRWAWVSVLTLVLGFAMGWLLMLGGPDLEAAFALYVSVLAVMAVLIPARALLPDHGGVLIASFALGRSKGEKPVFPTYLSAGALAATSVSLVVASGAGAADFWIAVMCATGLSLLFIGWSVRAQALQDQVVAPIFAFVAMVVQQAEMKGAAFRQITRSASDAQSQGFDWSVSALVVLAAIISCFAAWRAQKHTRFGLGWAGVAALTAPVTAIALEMSWRPSDIIGAYPWALHAAALAAIMVFWAERFARRDKPERRLRMSLFVLSALASISFAFVIIFSEAALTAALAVTIVVAAALDRKFDLRAMTYFIGAGVVTVGYRLVADPGLDWAFDAPVWEVLLSHGGALAAFVAALYLLPAAKRLTARVMLDSAAWSSGGMLISILLMRFLQSAVGRSETGSHWDLGLYAVIWLGLSLAQIQRLSASSHRWLLWIRVGLSALFGAFGLLLLLSGLTVSSPLAGTGGWFGSAVFGPPVFNTMIIAYLLPAAVLALGVWRLTEMPKRLAKGLQILAAFLVVYWLFCVIRHFWQGAADMPLKTGMSQPELYSYTIALLIAGAGLFYQSLARGSAVMRKAGLVVIGLAVAKVFLIDISGLEGLTRVFSLLVLGLSLAALAWLNRWAQQQSEDQDA